MSALSAISNKTKYSIYGQYHLMRIKMNFFGNKILQEQIRILANRQTEIVQIMAIFPVCYNHNKVPTFQQIRDLINTVEQRGYDSDLLYHIFASGNIPKWLDMIIKELFTNWEPSGKIVDGSIVTRESIERMFHKAKQNK